MKHTQKQYRHAFYLYRDLEPHDKVPHLVLSVFKEFRKETSSIPLEALLFMGTTCVFLDWIKGKADL